ncbi:MAG: hypothetical protein JOZ08_00840 [Verrucomicrobia bacterium]|nr:hypothetical protein [Verrucomicrobiota bacterium]
MMKERNIQKEDEYPQITQINTDFGLGSANASEINITPQNSVLVLNPRQSQFSNRNLR